MSETEASPVAPAEPAAPSPEPEQSASRQPDPERPDTDQPDLDQPGPEQPDPDQPDPEQPRSTRSGPGRVLVAVYGIFALSASARAAVQIATKFGHAPVPYLLSAFSGVVYIIATATLTSGGPRARRIAFASCSIELAGVLAVGTWSVIDPAAFPDASVWSGYGIGYGYVPLVLPVFGLLWLRYWAKRTRA